MRRDPPGDPTGVGLARSIIRTSRSARASQRVQIDEIWSFVGCKQKSVTPDIAAERYRSLSPSSSSPIRVWYTWIVRVRNPAFANAPMLGVAKKVTSIV
jgi:hypothetical protein